MALYFSLFKYCFSLICFLGVTTVLTLIFVIIEGKKDLPKVSYVTALDCFLAVCFIFVFSTLFEFALVHFYTKARTGDLNENIRELEDYVIRVRNEV